MKKLLEVKLTPYSVKDTENNRTDSIHYSGPCGHSCGSSCAGGCSQCSGGGCGGGGH